MYGVCRYLVHRVWLCCSEAGTVTQKRQTFLPDALSHCHLFISMHFQRKTKGFSYLISSISYSAVILSGDKKTKNDFCLFLSYCSSILSVEFLYVLSVAYYCFIIYELYIVLCSLAVTRGSQKWLKLCYRNICCWEEVVLADCC